jgi:hypothetical protein
MPVTRVAMKYWEQIAASSVQLAAHVAIAAPLRITAGRRIVDACGKGRRYIVESDELLSAFMGSWKRRYCNCSSHSARRMTANASKGFCLDSLVAESFGNFVSSRNAED